MTKEGLVDHRAKPAIQKSRVCGCADNVCGGGAAVHSNVRTLSGQWTQTGGPCRGENSMTNVISRMFRRGVQKAKPSRRAG